MLGIGIRGDEEINEMAGLFCSRGKYTPALIVCVCWGRLVYQDAPSTQTSCRAFESRQFYLAIWQCFDHVGKSTRVNWAVVLCSNLPFDSKSGHLGVGKYV